MTIERRWGDGVSLDFLKYGDIFVPDREEQNRIIAELIPPSTNITHVVDICCGEGRLAREILQRHPNVVLHGYDGSAVMLEKAKQLLDAFMQRFEPQLFDLASMEWRTFSYKVHAFVSSLAIHHLDDGGKKCLFQSLAAALVPGGSVVIADLVQPASAAGRRLAAKDWDEIVRKRSMQLRGTLNAFERFQTLNWNYYADPSPDPMDMPSLLTDQLHWLACAGFKEIDIHWMKAGHVILSASVPG